MRSPLDGLRPTLRSLSRSRGFSVAAILTLALGLGAATAIYTLIEHVVLDPLPYPASERLVRLKNPVPGVGKGTEWDLSTAQYVYFTAHAPALGLVGLYRQGGVSFTAASPGSAAQRVQAAIVTTSTLDLIGARVWRGRLFGAADDRPGAPLVAVLGYDFWRRAFGSDEHVVGETIHLLGQSIQVVGVMAPGVELPPERGQGVVTPSDFWLPWQLDPAGPFYNNHVNPAIARLASGATIAAAQAQIDHLTAELPAAFPSAYSKEFLARYGFHTQLTPLKDFVIGGMARNLWILFGAVALVLVIACANVANLFLVRFEVRRREFAIRTALGADWRDIGADALREGSVLALGGAALALGIGELSVRWLTALEPAGLPRLAELRLDGSALLFVLALGLFVSISLAAVPALRARRPSALDALGDGGRAMTAGVERKRLRNALIVSQVALAMVLVVGASLLLESFRKLSAVDPGIDAKGVLTVELSPPRDQYDDLAKLWRLYSQVLAKVRAIPGVATAGISEEIPFGGGFGCTVQGFEDARVYERVKAADQTTCAGQESTSPGYFRAMGIPLIRGRTFTSSDDDAPAAGAVIVSKAFAERFWPGEDPIGKGVGPNGSTKPPFYRVVGVVGDVHGSTLDDKPAVAIYYPVVQIPGSGRWWYPDQMVLALRTTRGSPSSYLNAVRRAVAEVDPGVPIANAQEMETVLARSMSRLTFVMTLLAIAGATALLLAAIGLYGMISYAVTRRTNEIGVRLALGARPMQVEVLVLRATLGLAIAGVALGAGASLALSRLLESLLYHVAPWDPWAYAAAIIVLGIVALAAGWIPARRAAAVDPAVALRAD